MKKAKAIALFKEALGYNEQTKVIFIKINRAGIQANVAHEGPDTYGLERVHYNAERKVGWSKWPQKDKNRKAKEVAINDTKAKRLHVLWHVANKKNRKEKS